MILVKKSIKRKGSSMLLVLMVMMSVLVFSTTSISATIYSTKGNRIQIKEDDLFYIAESGFEHGYARLMNENSEVNYVKNIDNAEVSISIKQEENKLYRIRSEAKKIWKC